MPTTRNGKKKAADVAPKDDLDAISDEEVPLRRSPRRKKGEEQKEPAKAKAKPKVSPKRKKRPQNKDFGHENVEKIDSVL